MKVAIRNPKKPSKCIILSALPKSELTRLSNDQIDKYYGAKMDEMWGSAGQRA